MLTNKDKKWIKDLIHNNTSKKVIKKKIEVKTKKRPLGVYGCAGGCDNCEGGC
jgi:hypothetical protein